MQRAEENRNMKINLRVSKIEIKILPCMEDRVSVFFLGVRVRFGGGMGRNNEVRRLRIYVSIEVFCIEIWPFPALGVKL